MLLLWDRNFLSSRTLAEVRKTKAHLLARVKSNGIFEPTRVLADGSFLAKMYASPKGRRDDRDGVAVRIIEYTFDDTNRTGSEPIDRPASRPVPVRAHSVVAMLYATLPCRRRVGAVGWPGKSIVTFSDALSAVRRWIWVEGVFAHLPNGPCLQKLPPPIREILYAALAPAA